MHLTRQRHNQSWRARSRYVARNSESLHPCDEGCPRQPESCCRPRAPSDHPTRFFERLSYVNTLHLRKCQRVLTRRRRDGMPELRKRRTQQPAFGKQRRPLDKVLQLAYVPRPVMTAKCIDDMLRNAVDGLVHAPGKLLNEMPHQHWNVFDSVTQGRQQDRKYTQPVI